MAKLKKKKKKEKSYFIFSFLSCKNQLKEILSMFISHTSTVHPNPKRIHMPLKIVIRATLGTDMFKHIQVYVC